MLRLLTTSAIMGADEVMSQSQAWDAYDQWKQDGRVFFLEEPYDVEPAFRALTLQFRPNPKGWSDSYLAAFAAVSGVRLVTFDRALQGKIENILILKP